MIAEAVRGEGAVFLVICGMIATAGLRLLACGPKDDVYLLTTAISLVAALTLPLAAAAQKDWLAARDGARSGRSSAWLGSSPACLHWSSARLRSSSACLDWSSACLRWSCARLRSSSA